SLTMKHSILFPVLIISTVCGYSLAIADDDSKQGGNNWPIAGHDLANTRSAAESSHLTADNIKSLKSKWVFTTEADVSATPAVAGNAVYFPDWAGNLYAVNRKDGSLLWSHKISDYDHVTTAIARVTPAVMGDSLILGDIESGNTTHNGA